MQSTDKGGEEVVVSELAETPSVSLEGEQRCKSCGGSETALRQGNGEWISEPCPDCNPPSEGEEGEEVKLNSRLERMIEEGSLTEEEAKIAALQAEVLMLRDALGDGKERLEKRLELAVANRERAEQERDSRLTKEQVEKVLDDLIELHQLNSHDSGEVVPVAAIESLSERLGVLADA